MCFVINTFFPSRVFLLVDLADAVSDNQQAFRDNLFSAPHRLSTAEFVPERVPDLQARMSMTIQSVVQPSATRNLG